MVLFPACASSELSSANERLVVSKAEPPFPVTPSNVYLTSKACVPEALATILPVLLTYKAVPPIVSDHTLVFPPICTAAAAVAPERASTAFSNVEEANTEECE